MRRVAFEDSNADGLPGWLEVGTHRSSIIESPRLNIDRSQGASSAVWQSGDARWMALWPQEMQTIVSIL